MRYISPHGNLKLYKYNGELAYSFYQHEFVGTIDPATQTPFSETLMRVYEEPISGGSNPDLEKCGLGYISTDTAKWRLFYESPLTQTPTVPSEDGIAYWLVNSGEIVFGGKTYYPGDVIKLTTTDSLTLSGNQYVSRWFYPSQLNNIEINYAAEFQRNALEVGDESNDYWQWGQGYAPKNSLSSVDPNFYGWYRK